MSMLLFLNHEVVDQRVLSVAFSLTHQKLRHHRGRAH